MTDQTPDPEHEAVDAASPVDERLGRPTEPAATTDASGASGAVPSSAIDVEDASPEHTAPARDGEVDGTHTEGHPAGVAFWVSMAIGAVVVANGIRGVLSPDYTWAKSMGGWLVAGGILVDLAIVPIVALVGLAGKRLLPPWAWRVVRGALLTTVLLVGFAWVLVFEPGGRPNNQTVRPRDYGSGLVVYLVVIWVLAGLALVASWFVNKRETVTL